VDTFLGILAPNFASAFGVFMIRQAIKQIPAGPHRGGADGRRGRGPHRPHHHWAAPQDHAGHGGHAPVPELLERLPLAVIVINSADLRTIPVAIALFKDPYGNINYGPLMAATVISTAPMLVAYAVSQKYMIRGIALTGLKG